MDAWGNEVLFFFFELSNEVLLLSLLLFHFHSFFEMHATADGPEGNKPTRGAGPLRRMMGWPICVSTPDGPVVALTQSYSAQKEPSSPALDSPDSGQSTSALATRVRFMVCLHLSCLLSETSLFYWRCNSSTFTVEPTGVLMFFVFSPSRDRVSRICIGSQFWRNLLTHLMRSLRLIS